ncbi:hypothetical protein SAMN06265795_1082 [Noviherbaspirillum humi]|uniref:Uncharacterized protein n=1 Tax=Noviherbaspirillum humi TaxID=1688639 RepID=A0A239HY79_9BURK|nr:hypothetical protein [Noviherbaspirillum humi]SNS86048.1 hypothetical protein SAMN06265795_1082 [Noviherbaspirillum humi]
MTTSTLNYANVLPVIAGTTSTAKRSSNASTSRLLDVVAKTLQMVQAVPSLGRVNAAQVERVRTITRTL